MTADIQAILINGNRVDLKLHEVQQVSETKRLSPQEVAILMAFVSRGEDATLKRLELYREAWGYSREPQGRALDYAMRRLREKLGATNPTGSILGTVRGVGYRLVWSPAAASSPAPAPATDPVAAADMPASTLPVAPALVGREALIQEGLELALRPAALVTLLGAGGIGKSSVAAAIGHLITAHTVVWVDLESAGIGEAEDAISRALFPPDESAEPLAARMGHLLAVRELPVALLLDGAERHLEELSDVLAPLEFPGLRILVTSRERLLLRREVLLQVPPLSRDAAEVLIRTVARRRGVRDVQTDAGIQSLLDQLDGMPLAVELAGARLRTRSADALARSIAAGRPLRTRERDRPDRHASMAAVVQASLERLSPELQTSIHDLAVFQGLFDLEAAARALGLDVYDAEEVVESLVDSSMLHFEEQGGSVMYRILRPTHTVLMRLHGVPTAARQRLVAYFDALGLADPGRALGRDGGALMRTLRPYALDLAALADDESLQIPGFAQLCHIVFTNIGMRTAEQRVARSILALHQPEDDFRKLLIARSYRSLSEFDKLAQMPAQMADPSGEHARLVRLFCVQKRAIGNQTREALTRALLTDARAADDHYVVGRASRWLGTILVERNDLDEAESVFQDYLTAASKDENLDNKISAWSSLARAAFSRGDTNEAIRRLQAGRALAGAHHRYSGVLLGNLGLVHLAVGNMEAAEEVTTAGLGLARNHGNIAQVIVSMGVLTEIYLELDQLDEVERYARQAVHLAMTNFTRVHAAERIWSHLAVLECIRGNFHAARAIQERWVERFSPTYSETSEGLLAPVFAWIEAGLGNEEAARALLAEEHDLSVVWKPGRDWLASQVALQLGDLVMASAYIDQVEALIRETGSGAQVLRRAKRTRARIARLQEQAN